MATVILEYGPAASEMIRVGVHSELRHDVDNDALRLHDGVKVGGYVFLNVDQNDGRYQARSLELDGFNFGAQGKGILTRVGPATYKLRRLESESGDITFVNPSGTAGNFDLRISDTILTDHTWEGKQTYIQSIDATEAGLDGETRGEHVGHVTGDVTGNLTGDAVGDHSGTFTGDVDVRSKQFVTDPGQILEEQIDPNAWILWGVPLGTIVMWSGIVASIPESWALCDGTNGTPDLRNRFIIGAGGAYAPGAVGGSTTATGSGVISNSGAHSHPLAIDGHTLTIDEMPAHFHGTGVCDAGPNCFNHGNIPASPTTPKQFDTNDGTGNVEGLSTTDGGDQPHTHTGVTAGSGEHSHELTLDALSVMPPYFALCFIMKVPLS